MPMQFIIKKVLPIKGFVSVFSMLIKNISRINKEYMHINIEKDLQKDIYNLSFNKKYSGEVLCK